MVRRRDLGRLFVKLHPLVAAAIGLAVFAPGLASAATFVKFGNRATFNSAAGPAKTENFDSVTTDTDLSSAYDGGDFSLSFSRAFGPYGSAMIDAPPFGAGGSINGTSFVSASVYNFGGGYSSLLFSFDKAITAFGANFSSGSAGNLQILVDGELVTGAVANAGDFFGFTSDTAFPRVELRARAGSGYTYHLDNLTYSNTAVPEPASWAMMIGGFALIGTVLRRRRAHIAFA